ncbi:MAG: V-type ATPase 116kDa subunit family protein [bacterium]
MNKIHMVVLDSDIESVTDCILREGHLQLIDPGESDRWVEKLSRGSREEFSHALYSKKTRIKSLLNDLHVDVNEVRWEVEITEEDWSVLSKKIDTIEQEVEEYKSEISEKENTIKNIQDLKNKSVGFPISDLGMDKTDKYSYLNIQTGKVFTNMVENLRQKLYAYVHIIHPVSTLEDQTEIVIISLQKDSKEVQEILDQVGFEFLSKDEEETISPEVLKDIDKKLDQARKEYNTSKNKLRQIADEHQNFLMSVLFRVQREILKKNIYQLTRKTEKTYLLSGWIPDKFSHSFISMIYKVTQNRCIIEEQPAEQVKGVKNGETEVPVQMSNPPLLKPFEILTRAYGIPAYKTVDPTPILGLSFLLMFGTMFGDVGHGLVLSLAGGFMIWKSLKRSIQQSGLLLLYAGIASMIFGFLFGSFFGLENLLPTLWLKPIESINRLFTVAIFFGIGMITLSIVVNMINFFKRGDFLHIIFDKAGLLAIIVYWCGILVASRMVSQNKQSLPFIIPLLFISGIFLLFVREPLLHLFQGKRKLFPEGVFSGIMGGLIELLELILGFLANTISFIRVAAFGLAHAGLFMAIFALSDAVKGTAGGIFSFFVLLLGNIIIILLEGLIVSIQAVRLEFYEFFGRFFQQSNIAYKPVGSEIKGQ